MSFATSLPIVILSIKQNREKQIGMYILNSPKLSLLQIAKIIKKHIKIAKKSQKNLKILLFFVKKHKKLQKSNIIPDKKPKTIQLINMLS